MKAQWQISHERDPAMLPLTSVHFVTVLSPWYYRLDY